MAAQAEIAHQVEDQMDDTEQELGGPIPVQKLEVSGQ
jgi:hypothetical protein